MKTKHVFGKSLFTISLDFELMWGVFDKRTIDSYGRNVKGVHAVIPKMLRLFSEYDIHATWAAVGCLFYEKLDELKADLPQLQPEYITERFSAYSHIKTISPENFKQYYSGLELLMQIKSIEGQEIGTHTFSHYYCLEKGQDLSSFRSDIHKAIERAAVLGIEINSIIFPRNQFKEEYLDVCKKEGLIAYRGTENSFIQRPRTQDKLNFFIRALRFVDTYVNITGDNVYKQIDINLEGLVNIPASFFFRPYSSKNRLLEYLKIRRYKKAMLSAAKSGSLFHLWWHPHNFGSNQEQNLDQLKEIIDYYKLLNKRYGMESLNMKEIAYKALEQ
jgi:peptidoglycan/xylan/chitin deacetylase (PgdA/CDA1 family)